MDMTSGPATSGYQLHKDTKMYGKTFLCLLALLF